MTVAAAILVAILIFLGLFFGTHLFKRSTANFRGQTEAIEKTKANADFRISSYQMFFSLCASIQSAEDKIKIFAKDTGENAQTNLIAVQSIRSSLIREYNGLATRGFTEGQFRSSNLPYQININGETKCAAS